MTYLNSRICADKRLLVLGGLRYQIPVIKKAKELGCYVISADIYPDNIAHKYSDEYCRLNIVNKDEVCDAAKALQVDGIMSFAVDPGVVSAAYACEKLRLPNVGPYESVRILQNKDLFRNFLTDNGFNSPKHGSYDTYCDLAEELHLFSFPLFVKPVDSAGSKGVTKVDETEDLEDAFDSAHAMSICGRVIVEEVIDFQEQPSDSDCFSINGDLVFFSMSNQYYDSEAANPYTPAAYIWPSSVPSQHQARIREDVQRLVTLLKMDTSVYNIETRLGKDDKVYIMECSPRGGGNRISEILSLQYGIDLLGNSVLGALGMHHLIYFTRHPSSHSYWGELVLHSNSNGIYTDICLDESIRKSMHELDLWVSHGDRVEGFSGANAAIGTIVLKSHSFLEMAEIIERRNSLVNLQVIGEEDSGFQDYR